MKSDRSFGASEDVIQQKLQHIVGKKNLSLCFEIDQIIYLEGNKWYITIEYIIASHNLLIYFHIDIIWMYSSSEQPFLDFKEEFNTIHNDYSTPLESKGPLQFLNEQQYVQELLKATLA